MDIDLLELSDIVKSVAQSHLMPHFNLVTREYKRDGSIVTEADRAVQAALTDKLAARYPDIIMMAEEMSQAEQETALIAGTPFWCLDPIDGTSNFAASMPFFCISLGLIADRTLQIGLVYDPIRDECFTAAKGKGAWLNASPMVLQHTGLRLHQTLALIDFKRLPPNVTTNLFSQKPFGSHRSLGSVALELCWLAAGRAHLYLHARQNLWDFAAGQLILLEAGGKLIGLNGESPISLTPYSSLAAVDESLCAEWHAYLRPIWPLNN
jgi:myo-inositol-1(or 4)-monophosphatase